MGKKLEQRKKDNFDKIKIGACLELNFLFDNIEVDFARLKKFLEFNQKYFHNQSIYTINKNLDDIQSILNNHIEVVLCDIDKKEKFCDYHIDFY